MMKKGQIEFGGELNGSFICIGNQDATMGVLYVLTIRTPLWEAICFTQTGQRSFIVCLKAYCLP